MSTNQIQTTTRKLPLYLVPTSEQQRLPFAVFLPPGFSNEGCSTWIPQLQPFHRAWNILTGKWGAVGS